MKLFKVTLLVVCLIANLSSCTYYFGPNLLTRHFKDTPKTIAAVYDYNKCYANKPDYEPQDALIDFYANMPLPDEKVVGHTDALRIMLAKLTQGRDVKQVNELLLKLKPWSGHGTQWSLHPHGDYDFTEITMCSLLYLFGNQPNLLYPKTREHLVHTLIVNTGKKQALRMPGTAGLLRETENHILMGEVSRYLKNQWLHENGEVADVYNNEKNGIEKWLLRHLDEKFKGGFFEFNSDPYSGYSMQALITLFSFTHSDTVRNSVNKLLNEIMYEYSLSSINQKRYPVFRRQIHRAVNPSYDGDPITSIVRVLVNQKNNKQLSIAQKQHGLIALLLKYRLNDELNKLLTEKEASYFARLGHGRKGTPEIYCGNQNYVLSAGGVQRGKISQIGPRPTILLLNDEVRNRDSCFYLCSKGKMGQWNNTGVLENFACTNSPVHIPQQFTPVIERQGWKVFSIPLSNCYVFTYSSKNVGLMYISSDVKTPLEIRLNNLIQINNGKQLNKQFTDGPKTIFYNLNSPKNKWIITKVNGKKTNRNYDKWERINKVDIEAK